MTSPFSTSARLVAYLRDSGGDAQNLSIPQQEERLAEYCRAHGLLLTHLFKDTASGTRTAGRNQFLEMVAYLDGKVPEVGVLIWEYARLARDYDDGQFYLADLRRRGYIVYSISDAIPDDLNGRLLESVVNWKNASFSRDLSRNVRRGLYYIVTAHHCYPAKQLPAGYRREPVDLGKRRDGTPHIASRLVPDEQTAPLVQLAFRMRAGQASHMEIHRAVHLYQRHYSYGRMLRSPIYIGRWAFGDLTVDDFCQPLIDKPTWDIVQAIESDSLQRYGPYHPRRVASPYLLSGLVRCGLCGYGVNGHSTIRTDGTPNYYYYNCDHHTGLRTCPNLAVGRDRLHQAVLLAVRNTFTPNKIFAVYQEANRQLSASSDETRAAINRKRNDLADLTGRVRRITSAIADMGHSPALLADLVALEEQQRRTSEDLAILESHLAAPSETVTLAEVAAAIENMTTILAGDDFRAQQLMLRTLIKEIRYVRTDKRQHEPHGSITFASPPGITLPVFSVPF